jgi:septum formation inhibitor MinC
MSASDLNSYSPMIVYRNNKPAYYVYDDELYCPTFPLEWARNHLLDSGPKNCANCAYFGSHLGVFVGYCANCAVYVYCRNRGKGLRKNNDGSFEELENCLCENCLCENCLCENCVNYGYIGKSIFLETYMKDVNLSEIGDPDFVQQERPQYDEDEEDDESSESEYDYQNILEDNPVIYTTEETSQEDEETLLTEEINSQYKEILEDNPVDYYISREPEPLETEETEEEEPVCDVGCDYKDILEENPVNTSYSYYNIDNYKEDLKKWKVYKSVEYYSTVSPLLNENIEEEDEEENFDDLPDLISIEEFENTQEEQEEEEQEEKQEEKQEEQEEQEEKQEEQEEQEEQEQQKEKEEIKKENKGCIIS